MTSTSRWKLREIDFLAVLAIAAIAVLGVMVRRTLSPDGVSYLDLADAVRRHDIDQFVQGYWSPLYPILLAFVGALTGKSGFALVAPAHIVNVFAVAGTIVIIWRWARTMASPWFGRAAIAALVVCSAEPPRVEALTPDLVLLLIVTWIGYELLHHGGRRWLWVGALFGLAYLTKTSTWPWILAAMLIRVAAGPDRSARGNAGRSWLVAAIVALLWIAPMSYVAGRPMIGVTGKLNYHWYLESSDARTPDTHRGDHRQYDEFPVTDSLAVRVASMDTTMHWTYQPWSDPDGWSYGIMTHQAKAPKFSELLSYWLDITWQAVSVWLRTLIIAVLLPAFWLARRKERWRAFLTMPRTTLVGVGLGVAGIGQYIAVHAEPRLIAPFVLLLALALLQWLLGDRPDGEPIPRTRDRIAVSFLGLAAATYLLGARINAVRDDDRRIAAGIERLAAVNATAFATPGSTAGFGGALASNVPPHPRVAVVGPVLPVLANIFWTGGHVVAQVPPSAVASLRNLPVDRRSTVLHQMFADRADVLWITGTDGSYNIVRVP